MDTATDLDNTINAAHQAQQRRDTRSIIQDAAFRMFGQYGYDGVSMAMVAKAAKITKASVYWHYTGKDDLYIDCIERLHAVFQEYIFEPMLGRRRPLSKLQTLFEGVGFMFQDQRVQDGVAGFWLDPSRSDLPDARKVRQQFRETSIETIKAAIVQGTKDGELNPDVPAEDMAEAIFSVLEVIMLSVRRHTVSVRNRILDTLARTFYQAYAAPQLPEYNRVRINQKDASAGAALAESPAEKKQDQGPGL